MDLLVSFTNILCHILKGSNSSGYVEIFYCILFTIHAYIQSDTKKWELLKNPTKIEEIQE